MALLEIKNLKFKYPNTNKTVLNDISFKVNEGEFVLIFGTTGSGKTTLLKMIKREIAPFGEISGSIYYQGTLLKDLDKFTSASEIGFVMQNPENQIVTDKVYSELSFGLENLGLDQETMRLRVGEMASFFGINDWFHKSTEELSGGEKQLLNLASIMVMQPKILLLDEPTSQLDPIASSEFIQTLNKINKEFGVTIIIIEHRLEEVMPYADRVIVIDEGVIIADDSPKKVGSSLNHEKLSLSLPSAMRIYQMLGAYGECPLTVREGKEFLSKHFFNKIRFLDRSKPLIKNNQPAIKLKDICFRYDKELPDIIKNLNLEINQGEIFTLVGGNGSGKTTLLKIMAGLRKPYRGNIVVNGKNIKDYKNNELYQEMISFLPQNPEEIFIENKVLDELKEVKQIKNYKDEEFNLLFNEIMDLLEIEELLDRHPYDLSGGEQQKVAFAKILLLKPKIILLDEPSKGLDSYLKYKVISILKTLEKKGITIIIVTHDLEFAARVSDRCAMLFDGDIISIGEVEKFFSGNNFYTTAANRISRHMYDNIVTEEDVVKIAMLNGVKCEK